MRSRRRVVAVVSLGLVIAWGCGGRLEEERVASTSDGAGEGAVFLPEPEYPPPPYEPPLIAIAVDEEAARSAFESDAAARDAATRDADASADAGCCAVTGSLVHPERGCHEQARAELACLARGIGAGGTCPDTATPSCAERRLGDGGVEIYVLWSTWPSLGGTGLEACADGGAVVNLACP